MNSRRTLWIAAGLLAAATALRNPPPKEHTATPRVRHPGVYSGRRKVEYPTPYEPRPKNRSARCWARAWLSSRGAGPVRPVDADTGEAATLGKLPDHVAFARTDLLILTYEWGVTYAGMLRAAEITGDARYRDYTNEARDGDREGRRACA